MRSAGARRRRRSRMPLPCKVCRIGFTSVSSAAECTQVISEVQRDPREAGPPAATHEDCLNPQCLTGLVAPVAHTPPSEKDSVLRFSYARALLGNASQFLRTAVGAIRGAEHTVALVAVQGVRSSAQLLVAPSRSQLRRVPELSSH